MSNSNRRASSRSVGAVRDAAMALMDADEEGDGMLSYDEFVKTMPPHLVSTQQRRDLVREIFDAWVTDEDRLMSACEYFLFSLNVANSSGTGVESLFRRFDASGDGSLDSREFANAVEDLGFDGIGHDVFLELDNDNSGSISYGEIMTTLKQRGGRIGREARRFLQIYAQDRSGHTKAKAKKASDSILDTQDWIIKGKDADAFRRNLNDQLKEHKARISDLFRLLTTETQTGEENLTLNRKRFVTGMKTHGFIGEEQVLWDAFAELDDDNSDVIGATELHAWLSGNLGNKVERARELHLRDGVMAAGKPLREIEWTPEVLHQEVQLALMTNKLAPLDLLRAWDNHGKKNGDGAFSKREFLAMMKSIINDVPVWTECVRDAAIETFEQVSGGDSTLDSVELERWLNEGWLWRRRALRIEQRNAAREAAGQTKLKLEAEKEAKPKSPSKKSPSRASMPSPPSAAPATRTSRHKDFWERPLHEPKYGINKSPFPMHRYKPTYGPPAWALPKEPPPPKDDTPSWMRPVDPPPAEKGQTLSSSASLHRLLQTSTHKSLRRGASVSLRKSRSTSQVLPRPPEKGSLMPGDPMMMFGGGSSSSTEKPRAPVKPVVGIEAMLRRLENEQQTADELALKMAKKVAARPLSASSTSERLRTPFPFGSSSLANSKNRLHRESFGSSLGPTWAESPEALTFSENPASIRMITGVDWAGCNRVHTLATPREQRTGWC